MIGIISGKIRFAANIIRVHGRFFSVKDKCLLFNGWIRGAIHANALVFLPFLKKGEIDDLQSAMNAGIRAVMGLRRFGYAGVSNLRKNLQIPSKKLLLSTVLMLYF